MSETNWPAGPYEFGEDDGIVWADGGKLALVDVDKGAVEKEEQRDAMGYLFAAAPDLYEALESVVRIADRRTDEFDRARAALAKARGDAL